MAVEIISWPNLYKRYVAGLRIKPTTSWIPVGWHIRHPTDLTIPTPPEWVSQGKLNLSGCYSTPLWPQSPPSLDPGTIPPHCDPSHPLAWILVLFHPTVTAVIPKPGPWRYSTPLWPQSPPSLDLGAIPPHCDPSHPLAWTLVLFHSTVTPVTP